MNSEQIFQNPYQPLLWGDRIFKELCLRVTCHIATLCHCKLLLQIEMYIKEFGCTATACIEHRPFVQSSNQVFSEWDPTALRVNCVAIHPWYWRPLVWMGSCCYTSTVGLDHQQHHPVYASLRINLYGKCTNQSLAISFFAQLWTSAVCGLATLLLRQHWHHQIGLFAQMVPLAFYLKCDSPFEAYVIFTQHNLSCLDFTY